MTATNNIIKLPSNDSFFSYFSQIQIQNNGEMKRLLLEDDYNIKNWNNNNVIFDNEDKNDNLEDNNYGSVNSNDVQMLLVEKNVEAKKKATISSFEWS